MTKIKVLTTGQLYNLSESPELKPGQEIIVEADSVVEPAIVICLKDCSKDEVITEARFIKEMDSEDKEKKNLLKEKSREYLNEARQKAFRHGLDMKFLDSDFSFDEKKLTLYFSAPGRIDFRSLVADMVGSFNKMIRLQQIGPREEAKLYGGFGKCGRPLCCATFSSENTMSLYLF